MEQAQEIQFRIMVVEDDKICMYAMLKMLSRNFPDADVIPATTLKEAEEAITRYQDQIHFYILDILLPDGSGIDALCDILAINPNAHVAITTATPLPEYKNIADAFGVLEFLTKPVLPEKICEIVRRHLYGGAFVAGIRSPEAAPSPPLEAPAAAPPAPEPPPAEGSSSFFRASLSQLTALDVIQLKCLQGATQIIQFITREGQGKVYIRRGEIIHADTGLAQGMDALQLILQNRSGGEIRELHEMPDIAPTLGGDWQSVLLHAVQAADESQMEVG